MKHYLLVVYGEDRIEHETIHNLTYPQLTAIRSLLDRLQVHYRYWQT